MHLQYHRLGRARCLAVTAGLTLVATGGLSIALVANASAAKSSTLLPPTPAAHGANVAAAQRLVLKSMGAPKFVAPGPAYNIKAVKKPIWLLVPVASAPPVPQVVQGFLQAAKAAGVQAHVCQAGGTPDGNALCLKQAAAAHAGSAVIWSVPLKEIAQPLAAARAAGVKVVSANGALRIGEKVPGAVAGEVSHNYYNAGQLNAAYAVAARGGALDALCINVPGFYVGTAVCDGFTNEVHGLCPKCKVRTANVTVQSALTQTPEVTNQAVLADPKLDFVIPAFDYLDAGVDQQLKSMSKTTSEVMVGSENGSMGPLAAIRQGNFEVVNAGQEPYWWGWAFLDAAARVQVRALGHRAIVTVPNELFTAQSLKSFKGALTYNNAGAVYGIKPSVYEKGYTKLWKKG